MHEWSDRIKVYITLEKDYITVSDFDKLELEDVNYTGDLFVFDKRMNDNVSTAFERWEVGKTHRKWSVLDTGMFFIENCDIQDVSMVDLFELIGEKYGIHRIVRIVPDDWDE